ncbi:hypothetical protein QBC47DRAFT_6774 [Echria macrotheca]|uniref:Uncharacterized protein n=1 Tax=Echria macrotheca TaxID=438768 RepID=A0AAJ0BNJ6_9PEZI|nr:hypothetical protein QBC47DRAFT_6774 [Echria macrotheca]
MDVEGLPTCDIWLETGTEFETRWTLHLLRRILRRRQVGVFAVEMARYGGEEAETVWPYCSVISRTLLFSLARGRLIIALPLFPAGGWTVVVRFQHGRVGVWGGVREIEGGIHRTGSSGIQILLISRRFLSLFLMQVLVISYVEFALVESSIKSLHVTCCPALSAAKLGGACAGSDVVIPTAASELQVRPAISIVDDKPALTNRPPISLVSLGQNTAIIRTPRYCPPDETTNSQPAISSLIARA